MGFDGHLSIVATASNYAGGEFARKENEYGPQRFHRLARWPEGRQRNPEELIAAALGGCFTMALAAQLSSNDHTAATLETEAVLTMETTEDGPTVTKIHLTTRATVPGIEKEKFHELAMKAHGGCPIARLLKAELTLDSVLL